MSPRQRLQHAAALNRHAQRFQELKQEFERLGYFCKGTVLKRMMKCGKAACACQNDPAKRHGPYFEWTYCPATIIFPYQRQLFLPTDDNYNLCKVALILYTGVDRTEGRALQGCTPSADSGAKTRKGRFWPPLRSRSLFRVEHSGISRNA